MNVLVLCTGNSARSILLESILNTEGKGQVNAFSAGSDPAGKVHPQSLALLAEMGHDTSGAQSKSWDEFAKAGAPEMDVVITVCDSAAAEVCPIWPGAPVRAHWGVKDPAAEPPENQDSAFRATYDRLQTRARAFLALPLAALTPAQLAAQLNRIGVMI